MNSESFRDSGPPLDAGDVHPSEGGCWFCHRECGYVMVEAERLFYYPCDFSEAFNTRYHPECAEKVGVAEATDPVRAYEREQR